MGSAVRGPLAWITNHGKVAKKEPGASGASALSSSSAGRSESSWSPTRRILRRDGCAPDRLKPATAPSPEQPRADEGNQRGAARLRDREAMEQLVVDDRPVPGAEVVAVHEVLADHERVAGGVARAVVGAGAERPRQIRAQRPGQ